MIGAAMLVVALAGGALGALEAAGK